MTEIRMVTEEEEKSRICNEILRGLPAWFGIEAAIVNYVKEVRELPFFAAYDGGGPVGFLAVKEHNPYTAEICVMGVRQDRHHQGIGRALVTEAEAYCKKRQFCFFTVKTLDESADYEPYARTRLFYHAMGFLPLEVFPLHWDKDNPCLFLAKFIG